VPSAEGRELIQGYAANKGRQGLHTNLIHYGFALFAPVAYAMVGLVRQRGAWIANLSGLFAVLGLSTLPGLVLLDYFSVGVEQVAGVDVAFDGRRRPRGYQALQCSWLRHLSPLCWPCRSPCSLFGALVWSHGGSP
jgi:hypothetical protein